MTHPLVKTNWLASPPLVVAYALALTLGEGHNGEPVFLKDIWTSAKDVSDAVQHVSVDLFHKEYAAVFEGTPEWQAIDVGDNPTYE